MNASERDATIEAMAARLKRRELSVRRAKQLIADCESLFIMHAAGPRLLEALEAAFCKPPTAAELLRCSGENAKAKMARYQGCSEVVKFLRDTANGLTRFHEARHG